MAHSGCSALHGVNPNLEKSFLFTGFRKALPTTVFSQRPLPQKQGGYFMAQDPLCLFKLQDCDAGGYFREIIWVVVSTKYFFLQSNLGFGD